MNRGWIAFHLREALEELSRTIVEVETKPDFAEIELRIAMTHAYSHLNTAWNSREVDELGTAISSEEDFYAWRVFPTDIDLD